MKTEIDIIKEINKLSEKEFLRRARKLGYVTDRELAKELYPDKKVRDRENRIVRKLAARYAEEYKHEMAVKLRKARKKAKMTQKDLAEKVGTSVPAISRMENGHQNMTVERIFMLLTAIGQPYKVTLEVKADQTRLQKLAV